MEIDAGACVAAVAFIATVIAGFGAWMFRIDRGLNKLNTLVDDVRDLRQDNDKEHEHVWNKLNEHGTRIGRYGEALAAIRAKLGHRDAGDSTV
jgi:hypothetical protein